MKTIEALSLAFPAFALAVFMFMFPHIIGPLQSQHYPYIIGIILFLWMYWAFKFYEATNRKIY